MQKKTLSQTSPQAEAEHTAQRNSREQSNTLTLPTNPSAPALQKATARTQVPVSADKQT